MSATALSLIMMHIYYTIYKKNKKIVDRELKKLSERLVAGRYFKFRSIHGEEEREEKEEEIKIPKDYMGYIVTPTGVKLRTPLGEVTVESVPRTAERVVRFKTEYPIRVYSTVAEASTPMFRAEIGSAFARIRRKKRMMEGRR